MDVAKVAEDLYVSKLDRPWLETPFVSHGFEVRDQAKIDTLQRCCTTVQIDLEPGNL